MECATHHRIKSLGVCLTESTKEKGMVNETMLPWTSGNSLNGEYCSDQVIHDTNQPCTHEFSTIAVAELNRSRTPRTVVTVVLSFSGTLGPSPGDSRNWIGISKLNPNDGMPMKIKFPACAALFFTIGHFEPQVEIIKRHTKYGRSAEAFL